MRTPESIRLAKASAFGDRVLHDLKQPLNVIRVVAQDVRLDVKKSRLDLETLPSSMAEVERAVDELTGRIEQLRAFARRGHDTAQAEQTTLEDSCFRALRKARCRYPEARIVLDLAGDPVGTVAPGDAIELSLLELLDNGVRAAEESERPAQLRMSISNREDKVVISVEDNGCGIDEELRDQIFEPFFSTWPSSGGLGLSLAAAVASACDGSVTLARTSNNGTTFDLALPR